MTGCRDIEAFFDGELSEPDSEAVRDHVAGCERCQARLLGLMQEATIVQTRPNKRSKTR